MYCISDQQIDFILNDISARGIETEGLQLNLLDHVCCIIEQELEEKGDFEQFYSAVIRKFYKDKLSEIEEETHLLLTNKNYYVMKKFMISSGLFSTLSLTAGIILKYMHLAGASILIVLGIGILSFVFLPLLVTLKIKEQQKAKDKLLLALGSLSAITIALAILFKIQHWPGANMLGVISPAILALVFLPIYFFSGIRNPETKINTIVSSMLIVIGCGLFFSLTMTQRTVKILTFRNTNSFYRSQQILKNEAQLVAQLPVDSANATLVALGSEIFADIEAVKTNMIVYTTGGQKSIESDFAEKNVLINDDNTQDYLQENITELARLNALTKKITAYNQVAKEANNKLKEIPTHNTFINRSEDKVQEKFLGSLNDLVQLQMLVLQNQHALQVAPAQNRLTSVK